MSTKTDLEKLQIMLPHWLAHNLSHAEEFEKWSTVAREAGQGEAASLIATAATHLRAADQALTAALAKVGAHHHGHAHDHGHDHQH